MSAIGPILTLTVAFTLSGVGCSSSPAVAGAAPAEGDDGGGLPAADASGDSPSAPVDAGSDASPGAPTDGATGTTWLRVMNLAPDAPALDFCVSQEGGTFVGPMVGTSAGIPYPSTSAYMALAPDYYDVRLVAAGAKDCSTAVGTYASSLSTLPAGQYATLTAAGDLTKVAADSAFTTAAHVDDAPPASPTVALRFVNVSSNLARVDFGTGSLGSSSFAAMLLGAPFGGVGVSSSPDAGVLDTNGYLLLGSLSSLELSAHATGGTADAVVAPSATAPAGTALTVFLAGGKTGDAAHPNQLVLCKDGASASSSANNCTTLAD